MNTNTVLNIAVNPKLTEPMLLGYMEQAGKIAIVHTKSDVCMILKKGTLDVLGFHQVRKVQALADWCLDHKVKFLEASRAK